MEVQVGYGLTGIGAAVAHHPVAVCQTFGLGNLGNHLKNVSHYRAVVSGNAVAAGNVGFGNHQNVGRRLGVDVPEGEDGFVLIDLGGGDIPGDDFTE